MGYLVAAIVGWAHRQRTIVVAIVALGLIVSIEGTRRLSFDADVLSLLPRNSRVIQAFRSFLSRFGTPAERSQNVPITFPPTIRITNRTPAGWWNLSENA